MKCDAYWDDIELAFETVTPFAPHATGKSDAFPLYPAPSLSPTGSFSTRRFRMAVLENDFLRIDIAPSLGGRIIGIYDKAARTAILPIPNRLELSGSVLDLEYGVWWSAGFDRSPYGLDEVDAQLFPPDEEGGSASAVLFGMSPATRCSWHASVTLGPGSGEIGVTLSILNRDFQPRPAFLNLRLSLGKGSSADPSLGAVHHAARMALLSASTRAGEIAYSDSEGDTLVLRCFADGDLMAPRQSDQMQVQILPAAGISGPVAIGNGCAISVDAGRIQCYSDTDRHAKLVILVNGKTLESPVDLKARTVSELGAGDLGSIDRVALIEDGRVLAETSRQAEMISIQSRPNSFDGHAILDSRDVAALTRAARDLGLRHASLCLRASILVADGSLDEALDVIDSALAYNAEDPLTWWLKAAVLRACGETDEECPEMPNAHFLAPLEPVLRAEAFLSQPPQGKEPSPIVNPVRPEAMLEVANLLIESGLQSDAARWLDECLRHHDLPMFRYLLAWMYLTGSKMRAEAATQIAAAAKLEIGEPYPSRHYDFRAVRELAREFPDDLRLADWLSIVDAFTQPKS